MDAWAAANIKLRADRDAMNDFKRREALKEAQAAEVRRLALADPRCAAMPRTAEPDVPMHAWLIDSVGDLYRITLH